MSMPEWIADSLDKEKVDYRVRHHQPRFTAQGVAEAEHVSGHRLAKVVIVKADDRFVEVVVPASQRVNLESVRQTLGAEHCRLANEEEIAQRFQDCEVGAVPPLRHWRGVSILADRRLAQLDGPMLFQAGTHEDAIEMKFLDWQRVAKPRQGGFTSGN